MRAIALSALLAAALAGADRKPTPEEACKFIDDAEQKLLQLNIDSAAPTTLLKLFLTLATPSDPK